VAAVLAGAVKHLSLLLHVPSGIHQLWQSLHHDTPLKRIGSSRIPISAILQPDEAWLIYAKAEPIKLSFPQRF
jgi:hypothetical protein